MTKHLYAYLSKVLRICDCDDYFAKSASWRWRNNKVWDPSTKTCEPYWKNREFTKPLIPDLKLSLTLKSDHTSYNGEYGVYEGYSCYGKSLSQFSASCSSHPAPWFLCKYCLLINYNVYWYLPELHCSHNSELRGRLATRVSRDGRYLRKRRSQYRFCVWTWRER